MDLMEHVRRPMVDAVRMLVVNSQFEPIDGGTMCVTPFHLIFSTRKQKEDELTVKINKIMHPSYVFHRRLYIFSFLSLSLSVRFFTRP